MCTFAHGYGVKNVTLAVISQILSTFCWDKVSYFLGTCQVGRDDGHRAPENHLTPELSSPVHRCAWLLCGFWESNSYLMLHARHLQLPAPEWRNFKYKIGWMPIQLHIAVLWVFRALCHRDLTSELFVSLQNQGCSTSKIKRGNWKSAKATATNTNQGPHNGS